MSNLSRDGAWPRPLLLGALLGPWGAHGARAIWTSMSSLSGDGLGPLGTSWGAHGARTIWTSMSSLSGDGQGLLGALGPLGSRGPLGAPTAPKQFGHPRLVCLETAPRPLLGPSRKLGALLGGARRPDNLDVHV
eukprot:7834418-Pyramimonas_sp.AAC.1